MEIYNIEKNKIQEIISELKQNNLIFFSFLFYNFDEIQKELSSEEFNQKLFSKVIEDLEQNLCYKIEKLENLKLFLNELSLQKDKYEYFSKFRLKMQEFCTKKELVLDKFLEIIKDEVEEIEEKEKEKEKEKKVDLDNIFLKKKSKMIEKIEEKIRIKEIKKKQIPEKQKILQNYLKNFHTDEIRVKLEAFIKTYGDKVLANKDFFIEQYKNEKSMKNFFLNYFNSIKKFLLFVKFQHRISKLLNLIIETKKEMLDLCNSKKGKSFSLKYWNIDPIKEKINKIFKNLKKIKKEDASFLDIENLFCKLKTLIIQDNISKEDINLFLGFFEELELKNKLDVDFLKFYQMFFGVNPFRKDNYFNFDLEVKIYNKEIDFEKKHINFFLNLKFFNDVQRKVFNFLFFSFFKIDFDRKMFPFLFLHFSNFSDTFFSFLGFFSNLEIKDSFIPFRLKIMKEHFPIKTTKFCVCNTDGEEKDLLDSIKKEEEENKPFWTFLFHTFFFSYKNEESGLYLNIYNEEKTNLLSEFADKNYLDSFLAIVKLKNKGFREIQEIILKESVIQYEDSIQEKSNKSLLKIEKRKLKNQEDLKKLSKERGFLDVASLYKKIEELEKKNSSFEENKRKFLLEIENLNNEKKKQQTTNKQENDRLLNEIETIKKEKEVEINLLKKTVEEEKRKFQEKEEYLKKGNEEIQKKLTALYESKTTELIKYQPEIFDLKKNNEELLENNNALEKQIGNINSEKTKLLKKIDSLESDLRTVEQNYQENKRELMEKYWQEKEDIIKKKDEEIKRSKEFEAILSERVKDYESEKKTHFTEIEKLQSIVSDLNKKLDFTQLTEKEKVVKYKFFEEEKAKLEKENHSQKELLQNQKEEIQKIILKKEEEIKLIRETLAKKDREKEKIQADLLEKNIEFDKLVKKLKILEKKNTNETEENSQKKEIEKEKKFLKKIIALFSFVILILLIALFKLLI